MRKTGRIWYHLKHSHILYLHSSRLLGISRRNSCHHQYVTDCGFDIRPFTRRSNLRDFSKQTSRQRPGPLSKSLIYIHYQSQTVSFSFSFSSCFDTWFYRILKWCRPAPHPAMQVARCTSHRPLKYATSMPPQLLSNCAARFPGRPRKAQPFV